MADQGQLDVDCRAAEWKAALRPVPEGSTAYAVIVRADYGVSENGDLYPMAESGEIPLCDAWEEDGERRTPIAVGEALPRKSGREIYWLGEVHPGSISIRMDAVDGSRIEKTVIATPRQSWQGRWVLARPAPVDDEQTAAVPLSWTESFGGVCPRTGAMHDKNPVGRGFRERGGPEVGDPLPRIQQAGDLWQRPLQTPTAVNLAPIPEAWRSAWQEEGGGVASPDQRASGDWSAGDQLRVEAPGLDNGKGVLELELPKFAPCVVIAGPGGSRRVAGRWDTVVINTKDAHPVLSFYWRGQFTRISPNRHEWVIVTAGDEAG